MKFSLKTKDFILIALLTVIYMILYMVVMAPANLLGALGHTISPGFNGLLAGSVIYFISRKVGKMWQYTFMTLLLMGVFALIGGGYLPWIITSVTTAIIADLIASRSKNTKVLHLAIASGIMHVGQAFGSIVPATFFADKYAQEWIARGQTAEAMAENVRASSGYLGLFATITVFVLSFIGIYVAHYILKKHLKEK